MKDTCKYLGIVEAALQMAKNIAVEILEKDPTDGETRDVLESLTQAIERTQGLHAKYHAVVIASTVSGQPVASHLATDLLSLLNRN